MAQDRAEQAKLYAATDDLLKRANLLQVRTGQLGEQIVARRRALFASAVFQQGTSILAPGLWMDVAREAPRDFSSARAVFTNFWSRTASVLSGGAALPFLSLFVLLAVCLILSVFVARRVIPREEYASETQRPAKGGGGLVDPVRGVGDSARRHQRLLCACQLVRPV